MPIRLSSTTVKTILNSRAALLAVLIVSAFLLIVVNYFTIRTLSALRAYTHGESQYSKGQKDAARFLIIYLQTDDPAYIEMFEEALAIPRGDSLARVAMLEGLGDDLVREGLLLGRNHPDDIGNMMWLFKRFQNVSFMKEAISVWERGDELVGELYQIGLGAFRQVAEGTITQEGRYSLIWRVRDLTLEISEQEQLFAATIGDASRKISNLLFLANLVLTVLIIGSAALYAMAMLHRLKVQNNRLASTNREMDNLLYTVTHDMRGPLVSLQGLVALTLKEADLGGTRHNLEMMQKAIEKQNHFIREIIDLFKNRSMAIEWVEVDMKGLVEEIVDQHRFMDGGLKTTVKIDVMEGPVLCDPMRIRIILGNLVSNAFKYHDPAKEECVVEIKVYKDPGRCILSVTDNGIGMQAEVKERIFDRFYNTDAGNNMHSSGLGLYITRETVHMLNGSIEVESEPGQGSTFRVSIPVL